MSTLNASLKLRSDIVFKPITNKARDMYKKILQKAWINSDINLEMKAFENLSIEHYHLGNFEKAKYYSHRYHSGIAENQDSALRKYYLQALQFGNEGDNYKTLEEIKLKEIL